MLWRITAQSSRAADANVQEVAHALPETLTDSKNADAEFFHRVRREPGFAALLQRLGFEEPYIGDSQHNAVFLLFKPAWKLRQPPGHERTLLIHFEAKDRREMRVEVGVEPWVGSIDKKPELKAALAPVLARKTRVIRAVRDRLLGAADLPERFEANAKRLLDPTETASHGVVKFSGCGYGDDPTVEQAARWFGDVLETVTPIIDEVADRHQEG